MYGKKQILLICLFIFCCFNCHLQYYTKLLSKIIIFIKFLHDKHFFVDIFNWKNSNEQRRVDCLVSVFTAITYENQIIDINFY